MESESTITNVIIRKRRYFMGEKEMISEPNKVPRTKLQDEIESKDFTVECRMQFCSKVARVSEAIIGPKFDSQNKNKTKQTYNKTK